MLTSGDEEYRSEEALPMLAKILSHRFGLRCTVLFAINKETGEVDPNTTISRSCKRFIGMDQEFPDVGRATHIPTGSLVLENRRGNKMSSQIKQQQLLAAVAVAAGLLFTAALLHADESGRPNVLSITTETETEAARHFSWRQTGASLALMKGEQVVWQFNHLQDGSENGAPYFHPLATLDGTVLTDLHPDDHLWHRGLRFAWQNINGLEGYWTWPEGLESRPEDKGNTDVTAVNVAPGKDSAAAVT